MPAVSEGTTGISPSSVVLPGRGETVSMNLTVVQDSVLYGATLDVEATPSVTDAVTPVDSSNTLAFQGDIFIDDETLDLSWYLGDQVLDQELDRVREYDQDYLVTQMPMFAYQIFYVDVEPMGLTDLHVGWIGKGQGTMGNDTDWGAVLYIYENTSKAWERLDMYTEDDVNEKPLSGNPMMQPWHYVNRTLPGQDKVIVLVRTMAGANTTLSTDLLELTFTYSTYPVPRMDLGGDGRVDWGFGTSAATGEMGRVAAFADNSTSVAMSMPVGGGWNDSASFLVPPGVNIQGAYVDYVPFTTEGQRQGQGYAAFALPLSESDDLQITNIPLLSHEKTSQVVLESVIKHNVSEQANEVMNESLQMVVGRHFPGNQSVAQSFVPAYDGPLTGIEVFLHTKTGTPGTLTLEVREQQTNLPIGTVLATDTMGEVEFQAESWHRFTFDPVQVQAGKAYSFRLHALGADIQQPNGYTLGYDQTQSYPHGTTYLSSSLDGTSPWTPTVADLAFRTIMSYAIDSDDAVNLSVLGYPGRMVDDQVVIDVPMFEYVDGNWTFQVLNTNTFEVSFDWSAWTRYILFPESPSIDVGDDGLIDWEDDNVSTPQPLDITLGVQRVVDTVDWPLTYTDIFGNVLYRVPINFTSTSEGEMALRNLVVYWNGSVTTSDISDAINKFKDDLVPDLEGMVNITVNVSSKSEGTLTVTSVDVLYDLPPYSLKFADVVIPEDEASIPLDLDTVIFDDHDNNFLNYTVVRLSGDENVSFNLTEENVLTFWGPANWSGSAVYRVMARDSSNLTYWTNPFNVTVAAVEDPPLIHGLEDYYVVYFGIERRVAIVIEDNDSDLGEITITTDNNRVWGDVENGTLHFLFPFSAENQTVEVNISDGEAWSVYSIDVYPEESNEPPEIEFPPAFEFRVSLDAHGELDLWDYVRDLESEDEELVWAVKEFPDELVVVVHDGHVLQVIPVAIQAGEHMVELTCTDPDDNVVYHNLTVRLVEELRHPPVILRGDDALPGIIRVTVGGKEEVNLALQKYWYDQEDFNQPQLLRWEAESLRPNLFSVDLDSNHKLSIRSFSSTGSGYFTLRLFDSDQEVSKTESVQVIVVEETDEASSWLIFALAAAAMVILVIGLMVASRRKGEQGQPKPKVEPKMEERPEPEPEPKPEPKPMPSPEPRREYVLPPPKERVIRRRERRKSSKDEDGGVSPADELRGRILELMVIHESTSLITMVKDDNVEDLSLEKEDELIEMSTLFAQERFDDANVGTIKAFKFNGEEVLVGMGRHYFLVARCSGDEFDDVAHEMKRSIVNIDVNMAEKIEKWYPGQTITPLEEELRELLSTSPE